MICRQPRNKGDMLRVVCDDSGQVWPDVLQKAPGRGAYVCWGECLHRLHDKRLHTAWRGRRPEKNQALELRRRSEVALLRLCRQYARRRRVGLSIGRDAVMHRIWDGAPLLVVLALDAGEALKRQILNACAKRESAGLRTTSVSFGNSALLGEFLERDRVSVLAVGDTPENEKWWQYCMWYEQLLKTE